MAGAIYIIDTSCLTQAHRMYYPFDIAPSFWNFMKEQFTHGQFLLTNKVADEIKKGKDELSNWIKAELSPDVEIDCHSDISIMNYYASIMTWGVVHPQYNQRAKEDFAIFDNADPFLVALALEKGAIVVSQEVSAPNAKNSIKLPDVCSQFQIHHMNTFALLRKYGFKM